MKYTLAFIALLGTVSFTNAQGVTGVKPDPEPRVITPGKLNSDAPSDAVILFDGSNLNQWTASADPKLPAKWKVGNGILTVDKKEGSIQTKRSFGNYQLHIEWYIPQNITGKDQARGNSGIFLAMANNGWYGYELQILDSYNNKTYTAGQAGSIYLQYAPLVNAARKPGEWQTYDIAWTAPTFDERDSLKTPASVTVFYNGVLVQNNAVLKGSTLTFFKKPTYQKHGKAPILLQAHGDPSEPVSYRNIWLREL